MRRWTLWLPLGLFAALLLLVTYGLERDKGDFVPSRLVGQKLPAFALPPALEGRAGLSSADLATGEPRLLNIFASWCLPCQAEAPQLDALARAEIGIDGVAIRDEPDNVAAFLKNTGDPFDRIGADRDGRLQVLLGSSGVPETYVIAGDGTILHQHIGYIQPNDVPKLVAIVSAAR